MDRASASEAEGCGFDPRRAHIYFPLLHLPLGEPAEGNELFAPSKARDSGAAITRGLLGLLALTAGATVANIYYCQPLLGLMARSFHVTAAAISAVAAACQLGYASGMLLLIPLGDSVERKKLILCSLAATTVMLGAIALSPNLMFLIAASYCLGAVSITPQIAVTYAAGLAAPEERGKTVGMVMSGLLIGILGSRTISGWLGAHAAGGWREVYMVAVVITLALMAALAWLLPVQRPAEAVPYRHLMRSLGTLLIGEPVLRRHMLIGALGFGSFSAFWTTLGFHLYTLPEHYGSEMVGLYGLFGVAGALAAPVAGRLSDRMDARWVNGGALLLITLSFVLMALGGSLLVILAVGVVLMDAGVQGSHLSNQTRIYALDPSRRNRLNALYMVAYFLGGAGGSALGSCAWTHAGWAGVCIVGAGLPLLGIAALMLTHRAATVHG